MSAQKFLLLPEELLDARRRRGLSQKAAALGAGVGQTVLCAMERGRRSPDGQDSLRRLAATYQLNESELDELLFAATHDQLLGALQGTCLEAAAELVSELLKTHRMLSQAERSGLAMELREIARGKRRVIALAYKVQPASMPEGAAM